MPSPKNKPMPAVATSARSDVRAAVQLLRAELASMLRYSEQPDSVKRAAVATADHLDLLELRLHRVAEGR